MSESDNDGGRRMAMLVSGILIAGVSPTVLHLGVRPTPWNALWATAILFAVSELVPVDIVWRRETFRFSFASIPVVVGVFLVSPALIVAARVLTAAVVLLAVRRQRVHVATITLCTYLVEVLVALEIVKALGVGSPVEPRSWLVVASAVIGADVVGACARVLIDTLEAGRWQFGALMGLGVGALVSFVEVAAGVVVVSLMISRDSTVWLTAVVGAFTLLMSRAYGRARFRFRDLDVLDNFTQTLGRAILDGEMLPKLMRHVAEVLGADAAWLVIRDHDQLRRARLDGHQAIVELGDDLDAKLLDASGDGIRMVTGDDLLVPLLGPAGYDEAMIAGLPAGEDEAQALVIANRTGGGRVFDDEDRVLFEMLSTHAGVALQNVRLVDRLRSELDTKEHLANHDPLTGLANRACFHRLVAASLIAGRCCAVLLVDLDRFKEVNDTLGHHSGDALLVDVSHRLQAALDDAHLIARLGGDEFALMIQGDLDPAAVFTIARILRSQTEEPFYVDEVQVEVGASIGIAFHEPGIDVATLLRRADVAMYAAKDDQSGVQQYEPELDQYSKQRLALVPRFRTAIEREDLEIRFQPQVDLVTGKVVGAEALLRWPGRGDTVVSPDEFVPIAEQTGLIRPLTRFVLEGAIRECAEWHRSGHPLRVSVNLSARNLPEEGLDRDIVALLSARDLPPDALRLEITETAIMTHPQSSMEMMRRLRSIGVGIAIDDFGTGHSSLAYLTGLPATELKVDKSFVAAIGHDPTVAAVVRTIVDLARNLDLDVVAEGVETTDQAGILARMGCRVAQGYLYGRPMRALDFRDWLLAWERNASDGAARGAVDRVPARPTTTAEALAAELAELEERDGRDDSNVVSFKADRAV